MNRTERMKELVELLNKAGRAYYQEDREIISNYEYDKLYDELEALEEETGITLAGSPTVSVGYEAVNALPKETHETPMLSLDKTKEIEVLKNFVGNQKTVLSWKMDDDCTDISGWEIKKSGHSWKWNSGRSYHQQCKSV